jgi:O-antigen ligase
MGAVRLILKLQLACMVLGAALIVYVLGLEPRRHHVAFACALAACYLVFTGFGTIFMQRAWRSRAARSAADSQ